MKKLSVLVIVVSLFLFACDLLDDASETSGNFWAQNHDTGKFYQVNAQLLAETAKVKVWAEKGSGVTAATAKKIADEYTNNIYVKMMKTFGYKVNIEKLGEVDTMQFAHYLTTEKTTDAKLTILLLDIQEGYKKEGDPYIGGYFYSADMYKNNPSHPQLKYSNEREMIYIDTYPSIPDSASSYETLAHEMQHLMSFVTSYLMISNEKRTNTMDTWIDEGLSSAAEWVYSGRVSEERMDHYNEDYSGLIVNGNNFFIWDNYDENPYANLDDYATVNLFFQYLRLQADKPEDIYFDIHTSTSYDYNAITTAESINKSHKGNWSLLLRDWHAANYSNNESGLYGYMNDSVLKNVKAHMVPKNINSRALFPGEGVYSKTNTAESVPAASDKIKYAGLGSSGTTPSESNGFANGARLTYNIDTNLKGNSQTGNTTGIAPSVDNSIPGGNRSAQTSSSKKFSGSFKVDASYFHRRDGVSSLPDIKSNGRSINKDNKPFKIDCSKIKRFQLDE